MAIPHASNYRQWDRLVRRYFQNVTQVWLTVIMHNRLVLLQNREDTRHMIGSRYRLMINILILLIIIQYSHFTQSASEVT